MPAYNRGWERVPDPVNYEGRPIYRNRRTREIAYEADAERLVALPASLSDLYLTALNIDLLTYEGENSRDDRARSFELDANECHVVVG